MNDDLEEDLKRFFILQFDEETIENIKNHKKNPFKSYYGKMINEMWKNDKEINKEKELINFLFKTSINEIKKKEEGFMENINTSFQILDIPKKHQSNLFQYRKSDEEYVPSVSDTDFSINKHFLRMLNLIDYDFCKNIFDLGIKHNDKYFKSVWYDYTYKMYCLRLKYLDKIIYDKPINQSIIINPEEQIQTSKFLIEFKSFNKKRKGKNVTYYLDTERELCSCPFFFRKNIFVFPNSNDNTIKNYLGKTFYKCKHLLAYEKEINKERRNIIYDPIDTCPLCLESPTDSNNNIHKIHIGICNNTIKIQDVFKTLLYEDDMFKLQKHSICLNCYFSNIKQLNNICPRCRNPLNQININEDEILKNYKELTTEIKTKISKLEFTKGEIEEMGPNKKKKLKNFIEELEKCLKKKERKKIERV